MARNESLREESKLSNEETFGVGAWPALIGVPGLAGVLETADEAQPEPGATVPSSRNCSRKTSTWI